jgi:hypothetical protein
MRPRNRRISLYLIFLGLPLFCLSQCSRVRPQGVQVGNGARQEIYHSQKYQFQLSYPEQFRVNEISPEQIEIVSEDRASSVKIQVHPGGRIENFPLLNQRSLSNFLMTRFSGNTFKTIDQNDLWGFTSRTENESFFVTPRADIIHTTTINVSNRDTDSRAIAKTLRFDPDVSLVQDLQIEQPELKKGSKGTLAFRTQRSLKNLNLKASWTLVPLEPTKKSISFYCNVVSVGELHMISFLLPPTLSEGNYLISSFTLVAGEANRKSRALSTLFIPQTKFASATSESLYYQKGTAMTDIAAIMIAVSGSAIESHSPRLLSIEKPSPWVLTEQNYIDFEVSKEDEKDVALFSSNWGRIEKNSSHAGSACIDLAGFAEPLNGRPGWFRIFLQHFDYSPSGTYVLTEFRVHTLSGGLTTLRKPQTGEVYFDALGNKTQIPLRTISVTNPSVIDIEPPRYFSLAVKENAVPAGEGGTLTFSAIDRPAGLIPFARLFGMFVKIGEKRSFSVAGQIYYAGENLFEIDFQVPDNMPTGEYALEWSRIFDDANNVRYLKMEVPGRDFYVNGETRIPVVKINVTPKRKSSTLRELEG